MEISMRSKKSFSSTDASSIGVILNSASTAKPYDPNFYSQKKKKSIQPILKSEVDLIQAINCQNYAFLFNASQPITSFKITTKASCFLVGYAANSLTDESKSDENQAEMEQKLAKRGLSFRISGRSTRFSYKSSSSDDKSVDTTMASLFEELSLAPEVSEKLRITKELKECGLPGRFYEHLLLEFNKTERLAVLEILAGSTWSEEEKNACLTLIDNESKDEALRLINIREFSSKEEFSGKFNTTQLELEY